MTMSIMSTQMSPSSARSSKSAVEKVEDFLRAESRLSQIEKPDPGHGETKGSYCWRLIRHCVKNAINLVTKAELKDIVTGHGVHHCRRLNHAECLQQVIYNKNSREYLTLDGKEIHIFHNDGRRRGSVVPEDPVNRLIYASHLNLFIGWIQEDAYLVLMGADFEVSSVSEAPGPILAAVYNENVGEVVTIGAGFLTSWVFRYGGRHLLPRKTTEEGLGSEDKYSLLVLEETASRSQKAFAACGTSVAVFNLFEGKMLEVQKELHVRSITALLFFNPLKYLVTAAKDGSIKVWDDQWHLQVVFVGHGGLVTALTIYPYGPLIMSSSEDNTIRVWSLETCDEVDKVHTKEPARSLISVVNHGNFASMSESHADLWTVQNLHMLHATIGHKVEHLKSTDHPEHANRILLMCRDASVRILSPATGDIITTLLGDLRSKLIDAAYAIEEEVLFAVYSTGEIIKCSTATNPCTVKKHWKCSHPSKACNYLLVYEYVISADIEKDGWAGMKRAIGTKQFQGVDQPAPSGKSANRTLLLGGRKDGHICVFNRDTGAVEFEIEAHGHKGVLSMIANSKNDQLISAGLDNIIKIWRLYPYAQESLAPLMSFYCAHTPIYMTVMRSKLSVAFQEHTSATYSLVMYNLDRRISEDELDRHDHGPEDDHLDSITGLSSCNKLKLIASCSLDGTVRIWNEVNNLVRVIRLNAVPHSLCFCSQKGDLLVGIGDHVHKIDYKNYVPKAYRLKMVSMRFPEEQKDKALPFDDELLSKMSRDDVKRLKAARSSFKFTHFVDVLTQEENDEVMHEKRQKEAAFSALEQRENELNLIKGGGLRAGRRPKPTAATKREAFEKYLKLFYDRPKIELLEENPFAAELQNAAEEADDGEDEYRPEKEPVGFFPAPDTSRRPNKPDEQPVSIRSDGFVPNSILVRLLWPNRKVPTPPKDRWVPPSLTTDQLDQIKSQEQTNGGKTSGKLDKSKSKLSKREKSEFRESPLFFDYTDDDEEKEKQGKEEEEEDMMMAPPAFNNSFMQKVQQALEKPASPEHQVEPTRPSSVVEASTQRQIERNTVSSAVSDSAADPHPPQPQREPKPRKPLVKFVSKPSTFTEIPDLKSPPPRRVKAPSPPPPPTPPRPVTPLPDFISRHIGEEWFDHFFPNCTPETMPKPWTSQAFLGKVLECLQVAQWRHRVEIVESLSQIHREGNLHSVRNVHDALLGILASRNNAPSCSDPYSKDFLLSALRLLHALNICDRDFYAELMVQFLEGDREVRNTSIDVLRLCGMRDIHQHFEHELDSWDIWHLEDTERAGELRKMAHAWLEKWMTSFKMHLEDSIERLKKGQNIHGRVMQGQKKQVKPDGTQVRGILKRPNVEAIVEDEEEVRPPLSRLARPPSRQTQSSGQVTVTFNAAPDASTLDNATYIEAINYFCDIETEKQLEVLRHKTSARSGGAKSETAQKNTVLVLPKLPGKSCLVRLGETHTSKCRPRRETAYTVDLRLPPLVPKKGVGKEDSRLFSMPTSINLPLKTVYMNPFPSPIDCYDLAPNQPVMLTLRTAQKYFVPERSYLNRSGQEQC